MDKSHKAYGSERDLKVDNKSLAVKIAEEILEDDTGVKFDNFLGHLLDIVRLPDPQKDETAYLRAHNEIVTQAEALKTPEEIIAFMIAQIEKAIKQGRWMEARSFAEFFHLDDEVKKLDLFWLDHIHGEVQIAESPRERQRMLDDFFIDQTWKRIDPSNQKFQELNHLWLENIWNLYQRAKTRPNRQRVLEYAWDKLAYRNIKDPLFKRLMFDETIRDLYDSDPMDDGETLERAVLILNRGPVHITTLEADIKEKLHDDAVRVVRKVSDNGSGSDYSKKRARELIERFLDIGILNFDQDSDLIDSVTR